MYSPQPVCDLALEGGGWSVERPHRFTFGKYPVPSIQKGGCASEPVWTAEEGSPLTEIQSPDFSTRSQSLLTTLFQPPSIKVVLRKCCTGP